MKKKIEDKIKGRIMDMEQQMEKMTSTPGYYLTPYWNKCVDRIKLLNDVLVEISIIK